MSQNSKWKTEDTIDKNVRKFDTIPREAWTPEMWQVDKQVKRDRERSRKRSYTFAFGMLKEVLSVDQKLQHVDILKLAKETIISLSDQLNDLNKADTTGHNELLQHPDTPQELDTKRTKVCETPHPNLQEGDMANFSSLDIDWFFDGDTADFVNEL